MCNSMTFGYQLEYVISKSTVKDCHHLTISRRGLGDYKPIYTACSHRTMRLLIDLVKKIYVIKQAYLLKIVIKHISKSVRYQHIWQSVCLLVKTACRISLVSIHRSLKIYRCYFNIYILQLFL